MGLVVEMSRGLKRNSERIFYILDLLSENKNMKFSEIQKMSGIPKSSLHGIMNELVDLKAADYDDVHKVYSLGFNFIQLSYKCIASIDILNVIDAACVKLSRKVGETVHAAILVNTDITYISKHEGSDKVSIVNNIGMTLPAHATAIGKSLLSGYSDDELRQLYEGKFIQQFTPNTIATVDELVEEISKVRERGYSKEYGEVSLMAACIGVPIMDKDNIVTSISITVPISKFDDTYQSLILNSLMETKDELESLIHMGSGKNKSVTI